MARAALERLSLACGLALLSGCVLTWSRRGDDDGDEVGLTRTDAGAEESACSEPCGTHEVCEPESGRCECAQDYSSNGTECVFDPCSHARCAAHAGYPIGP